MCKGIAVIVYEKNGELKGICTGISSHDDLCKEVEELRYGQIEPYRFELLYPCNLTFDRSYNFVGMSGIAKEQPDTKLLDVAFHTAKPFFMKHTKQQMQNAYLSGANLSEADLSEANLIRANLIRADLSGANLIRADLIRANLSEANLIRAYLSEANLIRAYLSGANFSGANLSEAYLIRADLSGADLSGANLIRADLSGANLSGANLSEAYLSEANLSGVIYTNDTMLPQKIDTSKMVKI